MPHQLCPSAANYTDDDLVASFRAGDVEALDVLFERYRRFAKAKARGYFLVGADFDDIEQEGMIGLFKAIRDFRPDRQASFRAFAELCVTRQIITAIKAATRQKHQPLNQYVSHRRLRQRRRSRPERAVEELLDDQQVPDPADEVVSLSAWPRCGRPWPRCCRASRSTSSRLYLEGRSYQEISELLGRHAKSIDNALQRIKRKLEAHLRSAEAEELAAAAVDRRWRRGPLPRRFRPALAVRTLLVPAATKNNSRAPIARATRRSASHERLNTRRAKSATTTSPTRNWS